MILDNSFFEDEVREGFYVPGMIKRAWAAEMEVLSEVDRVCEKYNIEYFADWGSLLATVRHGGFIPWDDDLDIVMKRKDYERFREVASGELPEGYEVYNYKDSDDYWLYICRVVGRKRICFEPDHLERFHQFPYICGIDIFVLDNVSDDDEAESARDNLARFSIVTADKMAEGKIKGSEAVENLRVIDDAAGTNFALRYKECLSKIKCDFSSDENKEKRDSFRRDIYAFAEKLFGKFSNEHVKNLTQLFPFGLQNKDFRFASKWYESSVRLPYETMTMPVPLFYDTVLRKRYGNYMHLVKNAGAHGYPFFETQHNEFVKLLDFELPSYKPSASVINGTDDRHSQVKAFRELILESYERLKSSVGTINNQEDCIAIQETAIELGNLCELYCSPAKASDKTNENQNVPGCTKTIEKLETICDRIFELHTLYADSNDDNQTKSLISEIQNITEELSNILNDEVITTKTAVFICFKPEYFGVYRNEYDRLKAEGYNIAVIPAPYSYKNYDGTTHDTAYITDGYPDDAELINYEEYDPSLYRPDIIYIQYPYDEWNSTTIIHDKYFSSKLRYCTDKLVYIPWFTVEEFKQSDERQYHNMKDYVLMPALINADEVILQSENMRELYITKLTEWLGEDTKSVWEKKIVASECENDKAHTSKKKCIMYHVELSSFVQYDNCIDVINEKVKCLENASSDKLDIIWFQDSLFEKQLREIFPDKYKEYVNIRNNTKLKCILSEPLTPGSMEENQIIDDIDAYYGDSCRWAMLSSVNGRPVMIGSYDL